MQAQQQRPAAIAASRPLQQQQQVAASVSRSAPQQQQSQEQQRSYNLSTTYANQNSRSAQTVFSCLYTHQKTQKKKRWKDGRLVLLKTGRAKLHDASPAAGSGDPPLDECEITPAQQRAILASEETRLETERYLITAEGPWTGAPVMPSILQNKTASSMNKILTKKFQKPSRYVPSQQQRPAWQERLAKRQRPLQPGELRRLHYGENSSHPAQPSQPNPNPNPAGYAHNNPNSNSYPNGGNNSRPRGGVLMNQPQHQRASFGSGTAPAPHSFQQPPPPPPVQPDPQNQNPTQQQWNDPPGNDPQQQPANHDPDFTTGPPDSFSLGGGTAHAPDQQQQQPQPFSFASTPPPPQSRGSGGTGTAFLANEFRASQFYGEEEEEEEEEENDTTTVTPQNVAATAATSDVWGMAATTNDNHNYQPATDVWGQFQGVSNLAPSGGIGNDDSSAPLTSEPERPSPVGPTARTGPLKDQAIDQEKPSPAKNPSNASGGSTTTNLHALFGVPPPPALEEETQPPQQASSQFVLPPASDSSSDSEEDHSQEQ